MPLPPATQELLGPDFAADVGRFIVPIFGDIDGAPVSIGSGFLASIEKLHFLVTAAHVLDNAHIIPGGLYFYAATATKRAINPPALVSKIPPGLTRKQDHIDVGIVLLGDEGLPPYPDIGKAALSVDRFAPRSLPREDRKYAFLGFPSSKGKVHRPAKSVRSASYAYLSGPIEANRYAGLGLSDETHVALHFDEKDIRQLDDRKMNFPKVEGISGSPLWELRKAEDGGPCVVGVMIEYRKSQKIVIATDIGFALLMLRDYLSHESVEYRTKSA